MRTSSPVRPYSVGRTVLLGNPRVTWREWLKSSGKNRDLLCLDPADPNVGIPARVSLNSRGRTTFSRFYGSLDPQRSPHVLIAALAQGLKQLGPDGLVQLYAYRATPVLHQTTLLALQMIQPAHVLVASGTEIDLGPYSGKADRLELDACMPPMVQFAQRKAHWMKLVEDSEPHVIDLREVVVEGARLGTGQALNARDRKQAGLEAALYAERAGASLFIVSDIELEESQVTGALDYTGCSKAVIAEPGAFRNLLCSFANKNGDELGMGILTEIDWTNLRAHALCTAVAPAPVKILRLGSLRVDPEGREFGELRPWQV